MAIFAQPAKSGAITVNSSGQIIDSTLANFLTCDCCKPTLTVSGLTGTCDGYDCTLGNGGYVMFQSGCIYTGTNTSGWSAVMWKTGSTWTLEIKNPGGTVCATLTAPDTNGCPPPDSDDWTKQASTCTGTIIIGIAPSPSDNQCQYIYECTYDCSEATWGDVSQASRSCEVTCNNQDWTYNRMDGSDPIYQKITCGLSCSNVDTCIGLPPPPAAPTLVPPECAVDCCGIYDGLFIYGSGEHCGCGTGWVTASLYGSEAEAKADCPNWQNITCVPHGGCCGHYWVVQVAPSLFNLMICCNNS